MNRYTLSLAAVVYGLTISLAQAGTGFLALEFGLGDIDLEQDLQLPFNPGGSAGGDQIAGSFVAGYLFPSHVYVDLAYTNLDSITLFGLGDVADLRALKLGVGYQLPTEGKFSFLGKVGLAFWDLDLRESAAFNPGPEEGSGFDGTDLFIEIGVQYRFTDQFGMTLTHSRDNYDVGDSSSTRLGVKFFFGGP